MSRMDMNIPTTIAKNAMSLRGSMASAAGVAGIDPAVVLAAIGLPRQTILRARFYGPNYARSVLLRGIRRGARVDVDDDAEAGAQATRVQRVLRQGDANRYALDDLGEVARRVFRRQ